MNLPWLAGAIALGLGFYGQSRAWGVERLSAAASACLLLSLPLLNTQVALAGHADLWMTVPYGRASIAFFLWLRDGDSRQGALALACPFVKIPGYVWLATFLPPLVLASRHRVRWLWSLAGVGIVLRLWFPLAGVVGAARLFWKEGIFLRFEVFEALLRNLFTLASWHLFWYVAVLVLLTGVNSMIDDRTLRLMALQVFLALGFVVGVYALTPRGLWATDFTQAGRAVLHVVPMLAYLIVALLERRYGPALIAGPTREDCGEVAD